VNRDGPVSSTAEATGRHGRRWKTRPGAAGTADRLERDTLIVLALSALGAWPLWGWPMAGGVIGGGLLAGISYWALKRAVDALGVTDSPPSPVRLVLGLVGRHALLLGAGYVIIGRLHLHPLGVLVGVSAVVVAAMAEAARSWR
jgi:hypothetical protein